MHIQDVFERCKHLLIAHAIVVISGTLRYDDFIEAWRLNGKEVIDIDRVIEKRASSLVIRWQEDVSGKLDVDRLKIVLEPFRPGSCDISLFYLRPDAEARMRFGSEWTVRPSRELREKLSEAVGPGSFRFFYDSAA